MKFFPDSSPKHLLAIFVLSLIPLAWSPTESGLLAEEDLAPIAVSFTELRSQSTPGATVDIPIVLSGRNWFDDAAVAYRIHPDSTAVEGEDFEFVAGAGLETAENPILLSDRRIQRNIQVRLLNNAEAIGGGPQELILELDAENTTKVVVGEPSTHTLEIMDLDPPVVRFGEFKMEVREGEFIEIPLTVSRSVPTAIRVDFEVVPVTASEADMITASGQATPSPRTISGTGQQGSITVGAEYDGIVNADPRRTFRIQLVSASALEESVDIPIAVDDRYFEGTIIDVDPLELKFLDIDGDFEVSFKERTTVNLGVSLGAPAKEALSIPLSFSGLNANEFLTVNDDELLIPEGANSVFFPITLLRRGDPPESFPKTLVVSIEEGTFEDGTTVATGEPSEFRINILKLDAVNLSFGRLVEPGGDNTPPVFAAESSRIVGRTDRALSLPIFISDPASGNVTFSVEIVPNGTTGKILNPFTFEDTDFIDWDYRLQLGNQSFTPRVQRLDNIVIPAGDRQRFLNFEFKQRLMDTVAFDNANAPVSTGDVTVTLRISRLESDDSLVSLGSSEFQLTIRDFPNVDISPYMDSLAPSGPAIFNPLTGFYEVPYTLQWSEALNPDLLRGYRSMRFEFSSGRFDVENPDPDLLVKTPSDPSPIQPFEYRVRAPFRLAWPTTSENRVLIQGDDWKPGTRFEENNATTVLPTDIILRNLNLPGLDSAGGLPTEYNDLDEDLDLLFEFTHGGSRTFDLDRINPEINPNGFRVTLSRQRDGTSISGDVEPIRPVRMLTTDEGNILFQLRTQSGSSYQIQYWDGEGEWKTASPSRIQGAGTGLFWLDSGLPKTDTPSKDVPFRLYRFLEIE